MRKRDEIMDQEKIDQIINKYQGRASKTIQVLMELQSELHWLPREVLLKVSDRLGVPMSEVMHIVTFYKTFSLAPRGRHEIHVCMGSSCHVRGAQQVLEAVQGTLGISPGETTPDLRFSLETGNCLGCCSLGPEIIVDGRHHSKIAPDQVPDLLKDYE